MFGNIKFVRPRRPEGSEYVSYNDLFRLCELSRFEIVRPADVRLGEADDTYICPIMFPPRSLADELAEQVRKCKVIAWLLERPATRNPFLPSAPFDQIWLSDLALARKFVPGNSRVRYVPVGGNAELCPWTRGRFRKPPEPIFDFALMAYLAQQRLERHPNLPGYNIAPSVYPPSRDKVLEHCRAGLCLHQDSDPYIEPLRYVLFTIAGLPLCVEHCENTYPYLTYPVTDPEAALADAKGYAEINYSNMTTVLTFDRCVMDALVTDDQLPNL